MWFVQVEHAFNRVAQKPGDGSDHEFPVELQGHSMIHFQLIHNRPAGQSPWRHDAGDRRL